MMPIDAARLRRGAHVISPHTDPPFVRLPVTQVWVSASRATVMFRISALASVTAAAGGWANATQFLHVPGSMHWDRKAKRWTRRDTGAEITPDVLFRVWRADQSKLRAAGLIADESDAPLMHESPPLL